MDSFLRRPLEAVSLLANADVKTTKVVTIWLTKNGSPLDALLVITATMVKPPKTTSSKDVWPIPIALSHTKDNLDVIVWKDSRAREPPSALKDISDVTKMATIETSQNIRSVRMT